MSAEVINQLCSGEVPNERVAYVADEISYIDGNITKWTTTYMCTSSCPCPTPALTVVANSDSDWLSKWNETSL